MTRDLAQRRLTSQQLVSTSCVSPADVVQYLVAVQAQDYAGAKWSIGLRLPGDETETDVERAYADGEILRTHLLRPTWHFVAAADIRWLLALTGPRVQAANAFMYRKVGLDADVARRSRRTLEAALAGGPRARHELRDALTRTGIDTAGDLRLSYLLMHAELEGVICSGPRRGKQFTYALLDARVPSGRVRTKDEALAELASRYFVSRGPATVYDMAKWSGLTVTAVRQGLDAVRDRLVSEVVGDQTLWHSPSMTAVRRERQSLVHLLSIYDEYVSAYKDRSAMADEETRARLSAFGNALTHIVVVNGKVVGRWKPDVRGRSVGVTCEWFRTPTAAEQRAYRTAARAYARFVGLPLSDAEPRTAEG
ncbi:MAG: winged helix DNA-binding domain-containing protein [Vicinamibacterales bacterium]